MKIVQGIRDYRALQRHLYRFTPEQTASYQRREIFGLLGYVLEHSPFYRRLYAGYPHATIEEFSRLPVIDKRIMMDNFDELNTRGLRLSGVRDFAVRQELKRNYDGYYEGEYVVGLSSGTSGNQGLYVTPRELTERLPFVFLARGGIPLGLLPFRILFLLRVFSQGFKDIGAPGISITYRSTMTDPDELVALMNRARINIVMAPPSMLRILIERAPRIRRRLKLVVSYAEVLEKEDKARISDAFGAPVHEIYQASEGQIGSTCRCGNLHINEDLVFVELFASDGSPLRETGTAADRMILTNLVNTVQPLIRYEMNDVVVLGESCACGSSFRVIDKVLGRRDDVLYFADRRGVRRAVFPDLFARWIITADERIREFKVVQTGGKLEITVDLFRIAEAEVPALVAALDRRIRAELDSFDIDCSPVIRRAAIPLPAQKSKYKRFERYD